MEGVAGQAGASAYLAAEPEAWEAQGPSVWSLLTASLNRKYPGFGCLLLDEFLSLDSLLRGLSRLEEAG